MLAYFAVVALQLVRMLISSAVGCIKCNVIFTTNLCAGCKALTAKKMKNSIYWDLTPCSPLYVPLPSAYRLLLAGFLLLSFVDPDGGGIAVL
jgi:hypothetical protein